VSTRSGNIMRMKTEHRKNIEGFYNAQRNTYKKKKQKNKMKIERRDVAE